MQLEPAARPPITRQINAVTSLTGVLAASTMLGVLYDTKIPAMITTFGIVGIACHTPFFPLGKRLTVLTSLAAHAGLGYLFARSVGVGEMVENLHNEPGNYLQHAALGLATASTILLAGVAGTLALSHHVQQMDPSAMREREEAKLRSLPAIQSAFLCTVAAGTGIYLYCNYSMEDAKAFSSVYPLANGSLIAGLSRVCMNIFKIQHPESVKKAVLIPVILSSVANWKGLLLFASIFQCTTFTLKRVAGQPIEDDRDLFPNATDLLATSLAGYIAPGLPSGPISGPAALPSLGDPRIK